MKNISDKYDIYRTRPRNGYKYTKYKMCLSMMTVMHDKKHPIIIRS